MTEISSNGGTVQGDHPMPALAPIEVILPTLLEAAKTTSVMETYTIERHCYHHMITHNHSKPHVWTCGIGTRAIRHTKSTSDITACNSGINDHKNKAENGKSHNSRRVSESLLVPRKRSQSVSTHKGGPGCIEALFSEWEDCLGEIEQVQCASSSQNIAKMLEEQKASLNKWRHTKSQGTIPLNSEEYLTITSSAIGWKLCWAILKRFRGPLRLGPGIKLTSSHRKPVPRQASREQYWKGAFRVEEVDVDTCIGEYTSWIRILQYGQDELNKSVPSAEGEANEDGDDSWTSAMDNTLFAKSIKAVVFAAQWRFCPHVYFIFPCLRENESKRHVDKVLKYVREVPKTCPDVRVTVICANTRLAGRIPDIKAAVSRLTKNLDELPGTITSTVNLDLPILMSLVADHHHGVLPRQTQPLWHRQLLSWLKVPENYFSAVIFSTSVLPVLRGRRLVCTESAARRFRQHINATATLSEETRASLILPPKERKTTQRELVSLFQAWSSKSIPHDLMLPIEIVADSTLEGVLHQVNSGHLPPMAIGVACELSALPRSIYLYGWANRLTTITLSGGVAAQVEMAVARYWMPGERRLDILKFNIRGRLAFQALYKAPNWRDILSRVPWGHMPVELKRWANPRRTVGCGVTEGGVWVGPYYED